MEYCLGSASDLLEGKLKELKPMIIAWLTVDIVAFLCKVILFVALHH